MRGGVVGWAAGVLWSANVLAAPPANLATGEYAPYVSASLPGKGFSSELVTEALRRMGRPLKLTFLPWKRAYELTRNGLYDASYPYARNTEREADFLYSEPLHVDHISMFVRAGDRREQLEQFDGRTVCIPDGYDLAQVQAMLVRYQMKLERPPDLESCFRLLNAQRVDAVPINEFVGWATAGATLGSTQAVRELAQSLGQDVTHLIAPRRRPQSAAFIADFNRVLRAMRADGGYERIRQRWLPGGQAASTP